MKKKNKKKLHHVLLFILLSITVPWIACQRQSAPCAKERSLQASSAAFHGHVFTRHGDVTPRDLTAEQQAQIKRSK